MALDYANLYLGYLDDQYIFNNNPLIINLVLCKRYIDDCFVIYKGSASYFEIFALYELPQIIKFTYRVKTTYIICIFIFYLDTNISEGQHVSMANLYLLYVENKLLKQYLTCKE